MEIKEYYKYRTDLLDEAKDEDGFLNESQFIDIVLPKMLDAKLLDSEDFNESLFNLDYEGQTLKINGYSVNNSGERLQLFIVNEKSIDPDFENIEISEKIYYENIFKKATDFIKKAKNGYLYEIQDEGAINTLINQLSSNIGAEQFDVIEIFLLSATLSMEKRGQNPTPKQFLFNEENLKVKYSYENEDKNKEILIIKKLIDLNFLYNIHISQEGREELIIDFKEDFNFSIKAIKAADETKFTSFLCVFPATILEKLYLKFSSRLLEKNVRSFLDFKGVNKGMKETISKEPEKFIAYNNGLTITAKDMKIEQLDNDIYLINSLSDFQIVNGGQTTASIYFSKKLGIDISQVKVMAKVNVAKDSSNDQLDELISKISQFSNSQSKVTSVDLKSRSPQLIRIKALSESIITPSNKKWFYEKSKGEFNTKIRIAGASKKNKLNKEYPKNLRFTSEQLGKYFCAWGDEPFLVKKGGERIFRNFLEYLREFEQQKENNIDRNFYESLIAKIILFRNLESIHGERSNSIGQLRSAVVPYSISILYTLFDGNKKSKILFNLSKIWKSEGLESDLATYCYNLMFLINALLIKYSKSNDVGEGAKKKDLWDTIVNSNEIIKYIQNEDTKKILEKYSIYPDVKKSNNNKKTLFQDIDFSTLVNIAQIHSKTTKFYKHLSEHYSDFLSKIQIEKIEMICHYITNQKEITEAYISFSSELLDEIRINKPEIFDFDFQENDSLLTSLDYIISNYNHAIENEEDLESCFNRLSNISIKLELKFDSIFSQIGRQLKLGKTPTINQIYLIAPAVKEIMKHNI